MFFSTWIFVKESNLHEVNLCTLWHGLVEIEEATDLWAWGGMFLEKDPAIASQI